MVETTIVETITKIAETADVEIIKSMISVTMTVKTTKVATKMI